MTSYGGNEQKYEITGSFALVANSMHIDARIVIGAVSTPFGRRPAIDRKLTEASVVQATTRDVAVVSSEIEALFGCKTLWRLLGEKWSRSLLEAKIIFVLSYKYVITEPASISFIYPFGRVASSVVFLVRPFYYSYFELH
jgi:hypothetical protein